MKRIQHNRHKVVGVDTESSDGNTEEEDAENADDDCEHEICHRVECKIDKQRTKGLKDSDLSKGQT